MQVDNPLKFIVIFILLCFVFFFGGGRVLTTARCVIISIFGRTYKYLIGLHGDRIDLLVGCIYEKTHLTLKKLPQKVSQRFIIV